MTNTARRHRSRLVGTFVVLVSTAMTIGSVPSTASPRNAVARSQAAPTTTTTTSGDDEATDGSDGSLKLPYHEVIGQEADLLQRLSDARGASEAANVALTDLEAKVAAKLVELG